MKTAQSNGEGEELEVLRGRLEGLDAAGRIRLLAGMFRGRLVVTSSFGLQAAVMLHLVREHAPEVPVVFIDTGYLFPETYRYAALLEEHLGLTVRVYQPAMTAARQEALHGKLWEQGPEGTETYARLNKIEPMNRALRELGAEVWLSGLRRSHSGSRAGRRVAERQARTLKVYPIIDWDDGQVAEYLRLHERPAHPLADAGYVTMGDWHSTKQVVAAGSHEATRFNGERYECGLHLDSGVQDFQI
jgi:phosphoadenosine phosphosulfate reductase